MDNRLTDELIGGSDALSEPTDLVSEPDSHSLSSVGLSTHPMVVRTDDPFDAFVSGLQSQAVYGRPFWPSIESKLSLNT